MAQTQLLTVGKLAEAWEVPKSRLSRRMKEEHIEPDLVKGGCGYYDRPKLEKIRAKLTA